MVADKGKYALIQSLRDVVFKLCPKVSERIIYGGIMFSLGDDFGGVFAYKHHISFEFGQGCQFNDPDHLLEGKGKYRRHLKLTSLADVETKRVRGYVQQAINLVVNT
ncbi:MAG: hypothetical protein CSA45_02430 [Gammaproteobacteria bacterium]|nr:MAG: hypothetical protein CSA45_02430 [Gammaproteobacteria bacterium]